MMAVALARMDAHQALCDGNLSAALSCWRLRCQAPGFHLQTGELADAMGLLAELAPQLPDHGLACAASAVAQSPDDVGALRQLGWALGDRGLFDVASQVLARALWLAPGRSGILIELAVVLEAQGRSDLAVEALQSDPDVLDSSFLCRHLLAHNALMAGELEIARGLADSQLPSNQAESAMAARVHRMLERSAAALQYTSLDEADLRGWHFVATGGLLLHLSPLAFDQGMCGRYSSLTDSYYRIRYCLSRLQWTLALLDFRPERVMAPEDCASLAIAIATARLLRVPLERVDDGPGLIVAYDLCRLPEDVQQSLSMRHPGQVLYAHATCWTEPSVAPDLAGLLYQSNTAPWDSEPKGRGSQQPASRRLTDTGLAGALADRVLHANCCETPIAPRDTDDDLFRFCAVVRRHLRSVGQEERPRMPAGGGPVRSKRL